MSTEIALLGCTEFCNKQAAGRSKVLQLVVLKSVREREDNLGLLKKLSEIIDHLVAVNQFN
jgi:hypothetical protein